MRRSRYGRRRPVRNLERHQLLAGDQPIAESLLRGLMEIAQCHERIEQFDRDHFATEEKYLYFEIHESKNTNCAKSQLN